MNNKRMAFYCAIIVSFLISIIALHGVFSSNNEMQLLPKYLFWQHHLEPPVAVSDVMVYVISLDRAPERYAATKVSLDAEGLKHTRFSAADGYLLRITDDTGFTFTGADLKNGTHKFSIGRKYTIHCNSGDVTYEYAANKGLALLGAIRPLTPGELGCLCSHRDIWQNIVANGYKNTLVLEDDIVLSNRFIPLFSELLQNLPASYNLLYLFYGSAKGKVARILNNSYIFIVLNNKKIIWGTVAYLITKGAAQKLLQNQLIDMPVDLMIGHAITNDQISAYSVADQKYVSLQEAPSLIKEMGRAH